MPGLQRWSHLGLSSMESSFIHNLLECLPRYFDIKLVQTGQTILGGEPWIIVDVSGEISCHMRRYTGCPSLNILAFLDNALLEVTFEITWI